MLWRLSTKFLGLLARAADVQRELIEFAYIPSSGFFTTNEFAGRRFNRSLPGRPPRSLLLGIWVVPSPRGATLSHGCCAWC